MKTSDRKKIKIINQRIVDAVHKSAQWENGEICGMDIEQLQQRIKGILESYYENRN
jgi:hypothetical protein